MLFFLLLTFQIMVHCFNYEQLVNETKEILHSIGLVPSIFHNISQELALLQDFDQTNNPLVAVVTNNSGSCLRFASLGNYPTNGLGHRILDLALLLEFASRFNATPLLEDSHFSSVGVHGEYAWFPVFSGYLKFISKESLLSKVPGLSRKAIDEWDMIDYSPYSNHCHVIFDGCDYCCNLKEKKHRWCTERPFPQAISRLAYILRPYFEQTLWGAAHRTTTSETYAAYVDESLSCINIVVHIRVGDINLGCGHYGRQPHSADVVRSVLLALNDSPCVVIQYLSEEQIDAECMKRLTDISSIRQGNATGVVVARSLVLASPMQSLWQMVLGDVLIGSGSSFSLVAAILSKWVTYVSPLPKEGNYNFATIFDEIRYDVSGNFSRSYLTPNGIMESHFLSIEDTRKYICSRIYERRGFAKC